MTPSHPEATAPTDAGAAGSGETLGSPVGAGPVPGSGPVPGASPAPAPALRSAPPHAHAALRAERVRVAHWRRLVRARMDLAAAAIALPEAIGDHVPGVLPDGATHDLPTRLTLADAVSTGGPEGELDRLEALRVLDRRLARYELVVTQELHVLGGPVTRRPGTSTREPGGHRPGPGAMGQTVPRT